MLNLELMWESLPDLLGGLVLTLELTVLSLIFGMEVASASTLSQRSTAAGSGVVARTSTR